MRIGVHRNTISIWERGDSLPESKTVILEVARKLQLHAYDTQRLLEASLTAIAPYWHLPYQRNPSFTGREEVLARLHDALKHERAVEHCQWQALSGLGGISKTQTAIEYAYRYANDYTAVFWISAEIPESLVASFVAIANVLNLPERLEQEQSLVVSAVIRWLNSHSDWLLIFDNVEDRALVKGVLPSARSGAMLFTSRRQPLGFTTQTLILEQMAPEEGLRFLLYRAGLLDPTRPLDLLAPTEATLAREIVAEMDGLPLALDQAGAYIEATQCGLSDYRHLLRASQVRLLDERDAHMDHPLSVTRTFTLAFERLAQSNVLAIELLTVCAFLAPEAIPDDFFIEGAPYLRPVFEEVACDPFQFYAIIKALLVYSLIQRNTCNKTVTMHRLVQAVLKGHMEEEVQRTWAIRVLQTITHLFPSEETQADYWQTCERLLPHALMHITLSEQRNEHVAEYIALQCHVATYLLKRARLGN